MSKGLLSYIHQDSENLQVDVSAWKKFSVSELFDVKTGGHVKNLQEGDIPRISVSGINNGITGCFSDCGKEDGYRVEENFITFSFLGTCFYHPYKASFDMKVHTLKPKDYSLNIYSGLFIVAVLRKQFSGTYGNQMSSSDLKKESILLPERNGKPDWAAMEKTVKELYMKIENLLI